MKINDMNGHQVLDSEIIYQDGSYSRVKYWLLGWVVVTGREWFDGSWISGIMGRETEVVVDRIQATTIRDLG